jgi:hypothetical protein
MAPTIPTHGTFIGIDWSGARHAGRKILVAELRFVPHGARLEKLERPFAADTFPDITDRVAGYLERIDFEAAGLDFCFALAPADAEFSGRHPAEAARILTERYDPHSFRTRYGPERRRTTDTAVKAPFAPTNLRMFRQTYWGIRTLGVLAAASFPIVPWEPWQRRALAEVLPAHLAVQLIGRVPYKGRDERSNRALLMSRLCELVRLELGAGHHERLVADPSGDGIDALLAAVTAGAASVQTDRHPRTSPSDGWIYTADLAPSPDGSPSDDPDERSRIKQTILELLHRLSDRSKTICPSEAARALYPDGWREKMVEVRAAAAELVSAGAIVVTRKGIPVELDRVSGPIRLRLTEDG